jgi:hypothetical protein
VITTDEDHSMHRQSRRRRLGGLLAGGALLLVTATALAAGRSITLNLKGGYKNETRVACTQRNHYTVYHRGGTLRMDGYISPAPALPDGAWRVKIKVKRCKGGRFVEIWHGYARGNRVTLNGVKVGHFRKTYRMRSTGYFFARAYYYRTHPRLRSRAEHFHVTR